MPTHNGSRNGHDRATGAPAATVDSGSGPPAAAADHRELGPAFHAKYQLVRGLGAGAMGEVYLARHRSLDRLVAVKTVLGLDDQRRRRFLQEGRALARLAHPAIVAVHDADEAAVPYLVFEYVEGCSLRETMPAGRVRPVAEAVSLVLEILGGLAVAHREGIVHRDIKPENVLVPATGGVKIADFGLARVEDPAEPGVSNAGTMVGTPLYMAPEQIRGEVCGPPADLYAVGIVLFELLSGDVPFRAARMFDVLNMHVQQAPPDLAQRRSEVGPALSAVVARALAKQPAERFASAEEFAAALRAATGQGASAAVGDTVQSGAGVTAAAGAAATAGAPRVPALVRAAVIVAAAVFAIHATRPPPKVDPRVVGAWETTADGVHHRWSVTAAGEYRYRREQPQVPVFEAQGTFETRGPDWTIVYPGGVMKGRWRAVEGGSIALAFEPTGVELIYRPTAP